MAEEKVNIGTSERPILVPTSQVIADDSSFWRGVASGGVLVGEPGGINIDRALKIGSKRENDAKSKRSR